MPLPAVHQLRQDAPTWLESSGDTYAKQLTSRLNELSTLSPYWPLQYGNQLVDKLAIFTLTPNLQRSCRRTGDQSLQANSLPNATSSSGWYRGVSELQTLQEHEWTDEKKGKYLTC
ncbi:VasL domain-containing protein [Enterobacter cloacae complex sp. 277I4]|uniref:VasL domain-containing protein n=1 Tax=Enterobacter cloacae complex sp. 277I4 TaxID=3395873 RepID=UPI003CEA719C